MLSRQGANDSRHLSQTGYLRRPVTSLTGHDLILTTPRRHYYRLQNAVFFDRVSQHRQLCLIEIPPRLIRIRDDITYRQQAQIRDSLILVRRSIKITVQHIYRDQRFETLT